MGFLYFIGYTQHHVNCHPRPTMPVIGTPKKVSAGTSFVYSGAMDTWGGGGAYNAIGNSCENIEGYGWVCKYSFKPGAKFDLAASAGGMGDAASANISDNVSGDNDAVGNDFF